MNLDETIDILFHQDDFLFSLTEDDVNSVGTNNLTDRANLIIKLCEPFFECCDYYIFWSTKSARTEAYKLIGDKYKLDANHGFITKMFSKWTNIAEHNNSDQMVLISFMISRIYALQATKNAIIFLGTDKNTEKPGFHVGNNLWNAELPVLRYICPNIKFIIVDKEYNFNVLKCPMLLPIWRRDFHMLDNPATIKSFVKRSYKQEDYDNWRKESPRNVILYGTLYSYCLKWKNYKNHKQKKQNNGLLNQNFY